MIRMTIDLGKNTREEFIVSDENAKTVTEDFASDKSAITVVSINATTGKDRETVLLPTRRIERIQIKTV